MQMQKGSPFTINTPRSSSSENTNQTPSCIHHPNMTRKKVKLGWIVSDSARKASLKKRRTGLLKKVSELCILCGVIACVIIYSENEAEPVYFPPSRSEVEEILRRFEQIPEMEKNRKMMNQESYNKERVAKHEEQLRKNLKKNREMQMNLYLHQIFRASKPLHEFLQAELYALCFYIEERWRECRRRMQFFNQATGEPLPPPPAHMPAHAQDEETMRVIEHEALQWDQWFQDMMKNDQNVEESSRKDKGKAVVYAQEGTSTHVGGMVASYEQVGSSDQGNQTALLYQSLGGESGILDFGLPQEESTDIALGQSTLAPYGPYGVAEGTAGGSGLPPLPSVAEPISFGGSMVFPHDEAGSGSQYDILKHIWNAEGMGTGQDFPLPHPDVGGSGWIYSMDPHNQNIGGSESGHAVMPLQGGTQGSEEGYPWMQPEWNFGATNTAQGTVFPDPYGDVGGSSGLYDMSQYNWDVGDIGGDYSMTFPQGDPAAGHDAYSLNLQQTNNEGTGGGLVMTLPQGQSGGDSSGYGAVLNQGIAGGMIIGQQGTGLAPGEGSSNLSTGLHPEDPMNIEEPSDPWAPYYTAEDYRRASDTTQKPGEKKDGGNNF